MAQSAFYFDAENCVGCRTCQVACKDVHDLPVGVNYRYVRTYLTGEGYKPGGYHISLPLKGCDTCKSLRDGGEECACVASCPQRVLEFGELDELLAKHAGERIEVPAALAAGRPEGPEEIIRIKECMTDPDFDEIIV
ncbi:MAG: hypothetical protein ACI362_06125 [Coriobacteriales bacterium]